jgi:hypothetical protein
MRFRAASFFDLFFSSYITTPNHTDYLVSQAFPATMEI